MTATGEQGTDILFVSMEDWDDVWRRNQFVCARLARRFPEAKILFVGLAHDVSNQVRRGKLGALRREALRQVPDYANIALFKPLKLLPNSWSVTRRINEAHYRSQVNRAAREFGLKRSLLWLNAHYAAHTMDRMGESAVLYDITDDWTALTQSESLTRLIVAQDADICRRAGAVVVCSQQLFDLKREMVRNLHLIPNGVDAEHYKRVLDGTGPLPEEAQKWQKPVFGYTGSIHPDRVDLDLVEALARRLTRGTLVMVGPVMLPLADIARLEALKNVALIGPVPYKRLPEVMRGFDVCITPHLMTPFTESLNPIKLWEYLAAGKPIVSTDIAGFRDFPQYVRIARDAEAFYKAMQEALEETGEKQVARRREAHSHSWEARVEEIIAVMQGIQP